MRKKCLEQWVEQIFQLLSDTSMKIVQREIMKQLGTVLNSLNQGQRWKQPMDQDMEREQAVNIYNDLQKLDLHNFD